MVSERGREQAIAQADYRFSRREVREYTHWGHTQLKIHLQRLEELEYLWIQQGGRGQRLIYQLAYDGAIDADTPHLCGLIDSAALKHDYDDNRSGANAQQVEPSRGQVGPQSVPSRDSEIGSQSASSLTSQPVTANPAPNRSIKPKNNHAAYRSVSLDPGSITAPVAAAVVTSVTTPSTQTP